MKSPWILSSYTWKTCITLYISRSYAKSLTWSVMDASTVTLMHEISTSSQNGATNLNSIHELDWHTLLMFSPKHSKLQTSFSASECAYGMARNCMQSPGRSLLGRYDDHVQNHIGRECSSQRTIHYITIEINTGDKKYVWRIYKRCVYSKMVRQIYFEESHEYAHSRLLHGALG